MNEFDELRFTHLCDSMERELERKLTPDERTALRASFRAVDVPTISSEDESGTPSAAD